MKTFDFTEQLKIGNTGEVAFAARYPNLTKLDGRKGDFITPTGRVVEVKSDNYSSNLTPNFFMERWSSTIEKKPGGPWQSSLHGCHYFVYLFIKEGLVYWFKLEELVPWLNEHEKEFQKRSVRNKGWTAEGWLVPRSELEHLMVKKDLLVDSEGHSDGIC